MTQIMTPSAKTTTAGQVDKAVGLYRAMLEKHAGQFDAEAVQTVLGQPEFATDLFAVFRMRVEAISGMIVRRVKVDRTCPPKEAMKATGRNQYVDEEVAASMPHGEGEEVDVYFFKLGRYVNDVDLGKEFDLRGLKPVDPYSLAAVNEQDPAFADDHPNATHWKDAESNWCYAIFDRWRGGRAVLVNRDDRDWGDDWWFAGVRKSSLRSETLS